MRPSEPIFSSWKARLALGFSFEDRKSVLSEKRFDGPLAVQKPFYPEGPEVCHAIVIHPPAGIAGGDDLQIDLGIRSKASALLTTPGAAKWYRSAGAQARQKLQFDLEGDLEWLPQETIVFDGALAEMELEVRLGAGARYLGWEILCLGRTGSGESFRAGQLKVQTSISRQDKPLWWERGEIEGGGKLMRSAAGLAGHSVCATLVAAAGHLDAAVMARCRAVADVAVTCLPGVLIARHLGDSSETAKARFVQLWRILRPALLGREAVEPRIWRT